MHRLTLAAILLAIGSIGVSQLPYSQNYPLIPVAPPENGGFTAVTTVVYFQDFPLVWFFQLGLIIIWIEYRKLIDIEKEKLECLSGK